MEARILDIVRRFAAKDGVQYPGLDVVLFHFLQDEIRIVATDGHCLAWFTVKESHNQQPGESITVNLSDLEVISGEVLLMVYDKNLFIASGEKTITVKAAGSLKDFPDYEKLATTAPPVETKHLIHPQYIYMAGQAFVEMDLFAPYVGTKGATCPLIIKQKQEGIELTIFIMPLDPNE